MTKSPLSVGLPIEQNCLFEVSRQEVSKAAQFCRLPPIGWLSLNFNARKVEEFNYRWVFYRRDPVGDLIIVGEKPGVGFLGAELEKAWSCLLVCCPKSYGTRLQ